LLLETGLGDAEEQLIDEETKEYKYVITKNNFKLLQNQVSSLEKENKELKAKLVGLTNDIANIKVAMAKRGGTK
jgi:molecular chaperone GrpE (heat shock protein)